MAAYYNEIDPAAAQWLRNLIAAGHIAPGDVDTRSIEDVHPADLKPYTQCHFFAGIGVWSHALRLAGWADERPVWTGSCPCQPFSAAGKGAGFTDERHLWPAWHHLISQCSPGAIFGEQVASKDAEPWLDLVHTDLEALGYAFGATAFPSAGVGAPHIRDRTYWVANAQSIRGPTRRADSFGHKPQRSDGLSRSGQPGRLGNTRPHHDAGQGKAPNHGQPKANRPTDQSGRSSVSLSRVANTHCERCGKARPSVTPPERPERLECDGLDRGPGPTNGFWSDADWLHCRDDKWRPAEPGTFPLADGAAARVVRLRAYGNAINAQAAKAFIECAM
jgi:DNA (cytosine-5)-methyltransferase 1